MQRMTWRVKVEVVDASGGVVAVSLDEHFSLAEPTNHDRERLHIICKEASRKAAAVMCHRELLQEVQ